MTSLKMVSVTICMAFAVLIPVSSQAAPICVGPLDDIDCQGTRGELMEWVNESAGGTRCTPYLTVDLEYAEVCASARADKSIGLSSSGHGWETEPTGSLLVTLFYTSTWFGPDTETDTGWAYISNYDYDWPGVPETTTAQACLIPLGTIKAVCSPVSTAHA